MKHAFLGIGLLSLALGAAVAAPVDDRPGVREREAAPYVLDEITRRAVDRSAAELLVETDGSLKLEFNGSHRHVYMARVGADGQIETFCATSEAAVRRFLFQRPTHLQ